MARVANRGGRRRVPVFGRDDSDLAIDLVVTRTEDGQSWDGMIFRPAGGGDSRRRRLAVLVVHGSVGNYLSGVRDVRQVDGRLRCTVAGPLDAVIKQAARHTVIDVRSEEPGLEETFMAFYGRSRMEPTKESHHV